jgi:signal transduction histidine kinase
MRQLPYLMPQSMLSQILTGIILVLIVFAIGLLSTHGYFESRFFKELEDEKGTNMAKMLANITASGLYTENSLLVEPEIDEIFKRPLVASVSLYRADGSLWLQKKKDHYTIPPLTINEVRKILAENLTHPKSRIQGSNISYTMPVKLGSLFELSSDTERQNKSIGLVEVTISNSYYRSLVRKGQLLDIGSVVIASLLAIFVSIFLARRLSTPVYRLNEGARRISKGIIDEPVSTKATGELAELTESFNQMQEALKEREQLMTELQQSQKLEAIGTLAGGIAHDFNNILSAIIGYSELTQKMLPADSQESKLLDHVLKAGDRAKDLVAQILTFSRQSESYRTPSDIEPVITEALKLIRASLPAHIEIKSDIQSGGNRILIDPIRIHQIVMNLCTNSYHAMEEEGGLLEVKLANVKINEDQAAAIPDLHPGNYLLLTVEDNGFGIEKELLDRIFDPFFTTKERGKGTGMGLALIHGIMKESGGAVNVKSTVGIGTRFDLYFPLLDPTYQQDSTHLFPSLKKGSGHILFVDDEKEIVHMGKQMLEFLGYKVTTCISSVEAFELIETKPDSFDLVITDQTMPVMSGTQLTQNLHSIRSDMPVIICTGHSTVVNSETASQFGASGFIMKPHTLQKFSDAIHNIPSNS